jgi:hypothetical protein
MKKYRVWHGLKGWIKHCEVVEANNAAEAKELVKAMFKQHYISKVWLISK